MKNRKAQEEIDLLLGKAQALNDPEMTETLAADLGVPDADIFEDFRLMGEAFTKAFRDAGEADPDRRGELVRMLMGTIGELMEQIQEWVDEDETEPNGRMRKHVVQRQMN